MHPILTVAIFTIVLGLLYGYAKNSSFMCGAVWRANTKRADA
jgi:hypothetical protein